MTERHEADLLDAWYRLAPGGWLHVTRAEADLLQKIVRVGEQHESFHVGAEIAIRKPT